MLRIVYNKNMTLNFQSEYNYIYIIQESNDLINWKDSKKIIGNGEAVNYFDDGIIEGVRYFRLKKLDF